MSKIDTIESISDKLAESSIKVEPKRCSYIRNWNSKCRMCMNTCPHGAIKRSIGHLSIDSELCTDCGACVSSCPASTMSTTAPGINTIVKKARASAEVNGGNALFTCEVSANKYNVDTNRVVVLPCLDYLDEYLILGLFAVGVKRVTFMQCDCEGCEVESSSPYINEVVSSLRLVMEQWNIDRDILVVNEIPEVLRLKKKQHANTSGAGRRDAFRQASGSVAGWLTNIADEVAGTIAGTPVEKEDPNRRIVVMLDEVFPPESYRSVRMLKMLDHLGTRPYGATIESRFWATVNIDPERCRFCGACSKMCVTRALKFNEDKYGKCTLTFTPSLCINCGLCRDSCLTRSMVYSNKVLADNLDSDVIVDLYRDAEPPKHPTPFSQAYAKSHEES